MEQIASRWLTCWRYRWKVKNFLQSLWIHYFVRWLSIGVILLGDSKNVEIRLFFSRAFFLEKAVASSTDFHYSLSYFLLITTSFSLDTSDNTTFRITSSCLTVCWENAHGILHPSSITISSESSYLIASSNDSNIFFIQLWDKLFSNSLNISFTLWINLFFSSDSFSYQLDFSVYWPV